MRGLIGARFIKNILVFECKQNHKILLHRNLSTNTNFLCHRNVGALRGLDASKFFPMRICCTEICFNSQISCDRRADHTLKSVVSSKTKVFECARKSLIFDIGRHDRHNYKKLASQMRKVIIIILVILVISLTYIIATAQTYEKFNLIRFGTDTTPACKVYYEKCTCYGFLPGILKSYPPQYNCLGLPLCKTIRRDEPIDCSQE